MVNPASGRAVVMVSALERKRVQLMDWGVDGGHLFSGNDVVLAPHGSH